MPFVTLRCAFTLVEVMVVVTLLSLIVLALMTVFNSTQAAFRASVTQTEFGGRPGGDGPDRRRFEGDDGVGRSH